MIIALLLIAQLQDGPIRTAPEPPPQASAAPSADPGPVCALDGRPITESGCPAPAATPGGSRDNRLRAEVSEERRERANALDREPAAPAFPPVRTAEDCAVAANRGPNEDEFDCALRFRYAQRADERAGPSGFRTRRADGEVPAWALDDPAAWEASECGAAGDEVCLRQARNRLAMARAGMAAEAPASGGAPGDGQNCRMVMRRSESGFGGSLSRVCGDEAESAAALERLREATRPAVEPCDRPASLETQDAWIARCRALPIR